MTEEKQSICTEQVLNVVRYHAETHEDYIKVLSGAIVGLCKVLDTEFTYKNHGLLLSVEKED